MTTVTTPHAMTIDGAAVPGDDGFDVVNPATAEVFARAPRCSAADLDAAMSAADRAAGGWALDDEARRTALLAAADTVEASTDLLAPLLTAEQGKSLADARVELHSAAAWLRYFGHLDVSAEPAYDDAGQRFEIGRRPLGVVAAIAPWNFPVALAVWKLAPALRAGNTVVLKPSPYTPLTTLALGELLRETVPAGVLNVVSGPDPLGADMVAHRAPHKISFTGSTATGRRVAASAAATLKRVTLELGGNDAAIVLDDADPESIADALFWSAFTNNGQLCFAVKRVYVPEHRYDGFVEALAARARMVHVGDGTVDGVQLGPVNNRPQLERVSHLVADALARGGRAAAGGASGEGPGYFYPPTVLTDVFDGMRIVDEEQFGPALPVVAYRDVDDAVRRANGTPYALTASVWSADTDRAAAVARRLDGGQVSVNAHGSAVRPDLPFSGHRSSGLGVENGLWGLHEFTQLQVLARPTG
ncbi:aldehyde dehydrogenase family protein [Streptomyces sp. NPDC059629]|uniref:aldehyde dehydrogenase family protein n=1 Tax=Streptomyces sp. NPDC059629 TaxID=3346889 RepID=UPI003692241C